MRRRSWGAYLRPRLPEPVWRRRPLLTPSLLLRAPLRRAGPPPAAWLRRPSHGSAPSPAGSCQTAADGRGMWQAGGPPEPPLRAPHHILQGGIHPRGREEEGDDGGSVVDSCPMQRGEVSLQGREMCGGARESPTPPSHLVFRGRVCACRKKYAEGLEVAFGGGPVKGTRAVL